MEEFEMLHSNLKINGKKYQNEKELEKFFASEHFTCEIGYNALEVEYSEEGAAFIGWIGNEEEVYYFDNGSGNVEPVDLVINVCPEERMMCYDDVVIKDIVFYFCETGERNPKYNWIEDDIGYEQ